MPKTDQRFAIANMVISLDVSKNHLKWKISDLARSAKVSRALIYYHFGKSKKEIILNAFLTIAEEFYGFANDRLLLLKEGKIFESLMKTRKFYLNNPAIAVFYQRWRMSRSPLQRTMIDLEKKYQAKLKMAFPQCTSEQIIMIHGIFHGLITSPFLLDDEIKAAVELLKSEIQ